MGTALSLMGDATLYTVLPTHSAEAGITLAAVGIILSVNRFIRLFLNGPTGVLYDHSYRRRLFVPGLFIGALSTAMYAAWDGFWPLLAGRLLWGFAWSLIWVGGATIILDVTTDEDRGRWTGLYQTWFFLGTAIGAFVGGLLTDRVGYSAAFWIGAGITAAGGVMALVFLPETRYARSNPSHRRNETSRNWRPNSELLSIVSLQGINRFVIAGVLAATFALLVQKHLFIDNLLFGVATVTGMLIGIRTILSMIAAPLAGSLSDKSGNRWGVTMVGLIIGALGMLLLIHPEPVIILVGIGFSAVATGSIQALVTTRTGDLVSQEQRGKAIGLLHTSGDLGSALGPITAYLLLRWMNLGQVYVLCAALFAVGAGISMRMYRRHKSSENIVPHGE